LIKILIVNFHYNLIIINYARYWLCYAIILQKKEGYIEHVWTHFVYNYNILVSPRLLRIATSLFLFSVLVFET